MHLTAMCTQTLGSSRLYIFVSGVWPRPGEAALRPGLAAGQLVLASGLRGGGGPGLVSQLLACSGPRDRGSEVENNGRKLLFDYSNFKIESVSRATELPG